MFLLLILGMLVLCLTDFLFCYAFQSALDEGSTCFLMDVSVS